MSNFNTKEFEPTSSAAWKQKIQVDLKGADYNDTLLTETLEGITIKPFYHSDAFVKLDVPEVKENFNIAQHFNVTDAKEVGEKALNCASAGVDSIVFIANQPFEIELLMDQLLHKNLSFHFQLSFFDTAFLTQLLNYLKNERVFVNLDCIGQLCSTGNWFTGMEVDMKQLEQVIKTNKNTAVLGINAAVYQQAGANGVQQIAYTLAHLNEYLNRFNNLEQLKLQINLTVGSHYFFEIAKLRALRYLVTELLEQFDLSPDFTLFAEPSTRNKTLYDYNVNLLRTSAECMSAILGGANSIANQSYDHLFHESTIFGERIARNQLLILKEEAYFNSTFNAANDSYYVEAITKQMAEKALELFKDIEKNGGLISQLVKGTIQRKIKENADKEQALFDSGDLVLLGSNKYPNEQDRMKSELAKDPFPSKRNEKTLIEPIVPRRLAKVYEQNRLNNEA